ncbi:MAG: AAA family ATPase [Nannocystis sp.]|nr:AAA family ATPase [Nannocystis sp.]MBA3550134.1 AAA family ATPase [Nannocystis sp.]
MTTARITEIHVEGMRTLADVRLKLDGLTVLIGENGTGKSSIIEACELCRRLASQDFMSELYNPHGGAFALLRDGASVLRLTITMQATFPGESWIGLEYVVGLARERSGMVIQEEQLRVEYPDQPRPFLAIDRKQRWAKYFNGVHLVPFEGLAPDALALASFGPAGPRHPSVSVVRDALQAIEVHLPFEVLPTWAARAHARKSEIRGSVLLQPADRLDLLGTNLVNVYYALREQSDRQYWSDTMDLLRLGLGIEFEEVRTVADSGGGAHALAIKWRGRDQPMTASALSDGQIAFLAFVGMYRLPRPGRTLMAIDEPELHLHPGLLARVVQIFEAMGDHHPVLLSTHSDRVLDLLSDPVASVRVCELRRGATHLRRLDRESLDTWLADFRGVGDLRSEGHLADVMGGEA